MRLREFVEELIRVSEKAADLARVIRAEQSLFSLLVEEKTGAEQNKRFVRDFKTLADVLIQETVKHDLGQKFGGLKERIFGEESNHFENTLGESITICVQENEAATAALLGTVLDGNMTAALLLAKVVHKETCLDKLVLLKDAIRLDAGSDSEQPQDDLEINEDSVGIWIDPIDATAQYIEGGDGDVDHTGIYSDGLRCVVVLIGAYDVVSGLPIAGVMNQPFLHKDPTTEVWSGRYRWGFVQDTYRYVNSTSCSSFVANTVSAVPGTTPNRAIVVSSSESEQIQSQLRAGLAMREAGCCGKSCGSVPARKEGGGFEVVHAAGAGYKLLCVVDRLAYAYLITKHSTYKWDTCAPHAVLRALGGGIVEYSKAFDTVRRNQSLSLKELSVLLNDCQLCYNKENVEVGGVGEGDKGIEKWSNAGGLIAYNDSSVLVEIIRCLI